MGIGALVGAGISAAGSLFGASTASSAASSAANAQVRAAQTAANTQQGFFNTASNDLMPYMASGQNATDDLTNRLQEFTTPVAVPGTMTEADLQSTPGYQFTLDQGLKATQNSAAARGLGVSGAAEKGAATYATGLSDQTYNTRFGQQQQQYQDNVTNQTNDFNRLYQTAGQGEQAAGALAGQAVTTGNNIAQTQIGSGSAQAAGINAAGKYDASGITGTSSAFNNALNQYLATGGGGLYASGSTATGGLANKLGGNFLNGGF